MCIRDRLNLSELQKESYKCLQVSDIFPEYFLLKVNNFNNVARDGLDQWIYFLKTGNIKRGASGKGLDEAKKVLDVLKLSRAERAAYEAYIKARRIAVGVAQSTILRAERAETALAEERRQKEEAFLQKEQIIAIALKTLISQGMSESQARKSMGIDV